MGDHNAGSTFAGGIAAALFLAREPAASQAPEVAVARALQLPGVATVLAGTSSIPHLRALVAAAPR